MTIDKKLRVNPKIQKHILGATAFFECETDMTIKYWLFENNKLLEDKYTLIYGGDEDKRFLKLKYLKNSDAGTYTCVGEKDDTVFIGSAMLGFYGKY